MSGGAASGMISVPLVELDAMKERWEQRLTNQKQVIDNLQAALDAKRAASAEFTRFVRTEVVEELRTWSTELKQSGEVLAAEKVYQYSVELRARADTES